MEVNAIPGAEWIESGSNTIKAAAADGGKISLTIMKDGRDWMAENAGRQIILHRGLIMLPSSFFLCVCVNYLLIV